MLLTRVPHPHDPCYSLHLLLWPMARSLPISPHRAGGSVPLIANTGSLDSMGHLVAARLTTCCSYFRVIDVRGQITGDSDVFVILLYHNFVDMTYYGSYWIQNGIKLQPPTKQPDQTMNENQIVLFPVQCAPLVVCWWQIRPRCGLGPDVHHGLGHNMRVFVALWRHSGPLWPHNRRAQCAGRAEPHNVRRMSFFFINGLDCWAQFTDLIQSLVRIPTQNDILRPWTISRPDTATSRNLSQILV